MDVGMKQQSRVRFSGIGQEGQGSSGWQAKPMMPPQQGTPLGKGEEYDAAYAATVAAVAYAIAAMEEQKAPPSQERKAIPEKVSSRKKHVTVIHTPVAAAPPLVPPPPPRRGESIKRPAEGSMISRWFSGKELTTEDGDDDEQRANVSVRRPPAQKKPEGLTIPGQNVVGKVVDSVPNLEKDSRKRSKRFEQEQANQQLKPTTGPAMSTTSFPRERKESRRYEQEPPANQRPPPPSGRPTGTGFSSDAEKMAAAWEMEKLAKIKKQYNETMQTVAEWEDEKKAKARRQKESREQGGSESKRAKALEEYNEEMKRINKVAAASRLTAEEKKRSAEGKVRQKAAKIRSTGKLPRSCGCF
ncbi:unnamed protein product [Alopecurus aequalis]